MTQPDSRGTLTPVTVLFADITASTTLYAQRGDVTAFALASECLDQVDTGIAAAGGRVLKRLGDGVLALFDNPTQAVRAAVALRTALSAPDTTVWREGVRVRFGISCGPAMLVRDDVFGDVVNVAARLTTLAGGDEIFLSGKVYELLSPDLRGGVRLIDQLTLRNRPGSVLVYEFVGEEVDSTVSLGSRLRTSTAVMEVVFGEQLFVIGPERPRITIGRHVEHDIRIDHEAVSRHHADLALRSDRFVVVDQSTNGTYIHVDRGPVLRVVREEVALSGSGRIVPGIEPTPPIQFRITAQ